MTVRTMVMIAAGMAVAPLMAQSMAPIVPPPEPSAIPLGTGGVPGMPPESWFAGPRVRIEGTTTVGWLEDYRRWLDMNGFLRAPEPAAGSPEL
jgi:hypothetical protein